MIHHWLMLLIGILAVDAASYVNPSVEGTVPSSDDTTLVSCPIPFVQVGGRCVHFDLSISGTWEEMRMFCHLSKSDLIVLSDPQFYVDILHYIGSLGTSSSFWIGASDELWEGEWVWLDGTPVDMGTPYWSVYGCSNAQEPDGADKQNCAFLDSYLYYYFNDGACSSDAHPICQLL